MNRHMIEDTSSYPKHTNLSWNDVQRLNKNALVFPAIQDDERLSAEEMDERRRQNIAYEYLCHLEEAKQ